MIKYENHCCDCATEHFPCRGNRCSRRNVPVYYCDRCGVELDPDDFFVVEGEELCCDCLCNIFRKRGQK